MSSEPAKTVDQIIANETFFGVYGTFEAAISALAETKLNTKEATYILEGAMKRYNQQQCYEMFTKMNVDFSAESPANSKHFFEFLHSMSSVVQANSVDPLINHIQGLNTKLLQAEASNEDLKKQIAALQTKVHALETAANQKAEGINPAEYLAKLEVVLAQSAEFKNVTAENVQHLNSSLSQSIKYGRSFAQYEEIVKIMAANDFKAAYSYLNNLSKRGDAQSMAAVCKLGLSEVANNNNFTALLGACLSGNVRLVKSLIEGGCNKNVVDNFGNNALLNAAGNGKTEVIRYLITQGFDKNYRKESSGFDSILLASQEGFLETVQFLSLLGCDVNSKNKDGANCAYFAAKKGHLEVLKFLHQKGADLKVKNVNGWSTIIEAAGANSVPVLEFLVSQGCSVDDKANNNTTPLHYAAEKRSVLAVEFLIKNGAKVNEKNNDGKTPLDIAKEKAESGENFAKIRDLLTAAGAQ
ncbi:ankyrin repeat protein, putative [Trichomonas vaginalis G3]|uniref:Ankyrin repeat protein, putative n=1 Tax=Trichomonas vaginalis (strain ATCC PRA-98 / G3) TaxID=412133 RepID=A2DE86_TRIV3|nr:spectrin binding [Trichomonas vaginalis G3]EAY21304.1 ankyrin repeat protein, putative [Trichomonas vaginalis G3]KAI5548958.1 spectrin binding [Trichomonas vaginalis G3]|eukprot:XP_001582290.1 ankyrin repeat protein [Trichomonas vaginalis G3]